jgi:hypothetical protein
MILSDEQVRKANELLDFFATEYIGEIPLRIHMRGTDDGHGLGGPPFSPEFIRWIDAGSKQEDDKIRKARYRGDPAFLDHRQRVTRVFRKIRRVAPREYYVLSLAATKGMTVTEISLAMNIRAEELGHPERYTPHGVTALLILALDKAATWY